MGGTHCGNNGWNSLRQKWVEMVITRPWQKWMELTVAKMGGDGDEETVAKMGGTHCGKNGLSW